MRERDREIAKRLGMLERVEEFEKKLLEIKHVVAVEFDLGCLEELHQMIFLPKYDIPVELPNYYDVRKEMLQEVLSVAREFGLGPSGDRIEDYGEHFYIVRNCDDSWKREMVQDKVSLAEQIHAAEEKAAAGVRSQGAKEAIREMCLIEALEENDLSHVSIEMGREVISQMGNGMLTEPLASEFRDCALLDHPEWAGYSEFDVGSVLFHDYCERLNMHERGCEGIEI